MGDSKQLDVPGVSDGNIDEEWIQISKIQSRYFYYLADSSSTYLFDEPLFLNISFGKIVYVPMDHVSNLLLHIKWNSGSKVAFFLLNGAYSHLA